MATLTDVLKDFPVRVELSVQWGDMDAAQHVNNTVYLRWAETSRIAYFDALGLEVTPEGNEVGLILGYQDCKYLFPVTYPDTLTIGARVTEIGEDRFMMQSYFYSHRHERLVAISNQRVVTYDYVRLEKTGLPERVRRRIEEVEGKG